MFKVTKNSCLEKSCGVLPWVVCVACVRVIRASAGGMVACLRWWCGWCASVGDVPLRVTLLVYQR